MSKTLSDAKIRFVDGKFLVSGKLAFSNVSDLYKSSLLSMDQVQELVFDFSQVTGSDSSGLALMIEWVKLAEKKGKGIKLQYVPAELMSLARVSSLDKLIM